MAPYAETTLLVVFHLLAAFGLAQTLRALHPDRTTALPAALWLLTPVFGQLLLSQLLPVEWITRGHEGFSGNHLGAIAGGQSDYSPYAYRLWTPAAAVIPVPLRTMVGLSAASALLWLCAAAVLCRRAGLDAVPTAALVFGALVSPALSYAATAETSGTWTALCTLAVVPALVLAGPPYDRHHLRAAVPTALAFTVVVAIARPELGAVVLLALLVRLGARSERLQRMEQRWHDLLSPGRLLGATLTLGVLIALPRPPDMQLPIPRGHGELDWLLRALHPANPTWMLTPLYAACAFPLAWVTLAVVGWVGAARRPLTWGALAGLPWLWATYQSAAHGWPERSGYSAFEVARYLPLVSSWLLVLAVFGWHRLAHLPRLRLVLCAACLVPPLPLPGWLGAWRDANGYSAAPTLFTLDDNDPTWELRELLDHHEHSPRCVLLTRSPRWGGATHQEWVGLGRPGWTLTVRTGDALLHPVDAVHQLFPGARCARVWVGTSAHTEQHPPPDLTELRPLHVYPRLPRPSVHPEHGLTWAGTPVLVGWYAIEGVPYDVDGLP